MRVLIKFRIWLNRLFGFQTVKLSKSLSNNTLARCYSLFLCVMIIISEGLHLCYSRAAYGGKETVAGFILLSLSVSNSAGSAIAILSDSCIYAIEKVNLYNNFKKLHHTFFPVNFSQSTVIEPTNNVFIAIILFKCVHLSLMLWAWEWGMLIIFIVSRMSILSLMTLQIVTEIYMCEIHVRCIRNTLLSSHSQQVGDKSGIDFTEASFNLTGSNGRQVKMSLKEKLKSDIKVQMKIYIIINENLKIIANRFKYAVGKNIFIMHHFY